MSTFSFKILPEHNIFLEPGHASTEGGGTAATKHLLKAGGWEQEQPGWHGVTSGTRMATGHMSPPGHSCRLCTGSRELKPAKLTGRKARGDLAPPQPPQCCKVGGALVLLRSSWRPSGANICSGSGFPTTRRAGTSRRLDFSCSSAVVNNSPGQKSLCTALAELCSFDGPEGHVLTAPELFSRTCESDEEVKPPFPRYEKIGIFQRIKSLCKQNKKVESAFLQHSHRLSAAPELSRLLFPAAARR